MVPVKAAGEEGSLVCGGPCEGGEEDPLFLRVVALVREVLDDFERGSDVPLRHRVVEVDVFRHAVQDVQEVLDYDVLFPEDLGGFLHRLRPAGLWPSGNEPTARSVLTPARVRIRRTSGANENQIAR